MFRLGVARAEAERIHGPLTRTPFLVTDNGPSFIARRFGRYIQDLYRHVRIQYRTPTQLGLLEVYRDDEAVRIPRRQSWAKGAKEKLDRMLAEAA